MGPTDDTAPDDTTVPTQVWIPKLLGSGVGVARTLYLAGAKLEIEKEPSVLFEVVEAVIIPVNTLTTSIRQTTLEGLTDPLIPPVPGALEVTVVVPPAFGLELGLEQEKREKNKIKAKNLDRVIIFIELYNKPNPVLEIDLIFYEFNFANVSPMRFLW